MLFLKASPLLTLSTELLPLGFLPPHWPLWLISFPDLLLIFCSSGSCSTPRIVFSHILSRWPTIISVCSDPFSGFSSLCFFSPDLAGLHAADGLKMEAIMWWGMGAASRCSSGPRLMASWGLWTQVLQTQETEFCSSQEWVWKRTLKPEENTASQPPLWFQLKKRTQTHQPGFLSWQMPVKPGSWWFVTKQQKINTPVFV